jgi:predicted protein tyrosine phosphatase
MLPRPGFGVFADAAPEPEPEPEPAEARAPAPTAGSAVAHNSTADMIQREQDLKQLVSELDAARGITVTAASSGGAAATVDEQMDYDEEARKLFATQSIKGTLGSQKPNVNPIWRHPHTGASVFVGNKEAAYDVAAGGLLESLDISHAVDCRVSSKDRYFSGDDVLPAGAERGAVPPRRCRFEIENYWRFCYSAADSQLVAGCPGCDFARATCADATHTRLLESDRGMQQFFSPLFQWIDDATANGHNVLIHCLAGAHRAGSTAIAFLMYKHGLDAREATIAAKRCRACIDPLGGFTGLLVRLDVAMARGAQSKPLAGAFRGVVVGDRLLRRGRLAQAAAAAAAAGSRYAE